MNKKIVFSGIQPTGSINLGGYLGAIKNWVSMQDVHSCMFCVMNNHAITVPQNPKELQDSTLGVIASYIACGIDVEKSPIYAQSQVREHTELGWILGCLTPMGWLNRMTQFKSKAGSSKEKASLGLYAYPALMAADILIYKANLVPVGEDQIQHVELARDIAGLFNRTFNCEFFPLPEAMVDKTAMRIMSLRDASNKMSKSDPLDASRINLTDSNELIVSKIKRAVTDSIVSIYYDPQNRPAVSNLLNIYAAINNITIEKASTEMALVNTSTFKSLLADLIVSHLSPIRSEIERLLINDKQALKVIMNNGAESALAIAQGNMKEVRDIVGIYQPS